MNRQQAMELQDTIKYLNFRRVAFAIQDDKKIIATITKQDRFFRANGVIISKNAAMAILENQSI